MQFRLAKLQNTGVLISEDPLYTRFHWLDAIPLIVAMTQNMVIATTNATYLHP